MDEHPFRKGSLSRAWRRDLPPGAKPRAGGLVFFGSREGQFIACDAKSGKMLWHFNAGGSIRASPTSYMARGKQYIAIVTKTALFSFALPED
jgi:outer membrane protein assembly factor BamB